MPAPNHETRTHLEPPVTGGQLARDLEAAHDARPEDGQESWLNDRLARLEDWRNAAHEQIGLPPRNSNSLDASMLGSETELHPQPATTSEAGNADEQKIELQELLSGAHLGRVAISKISSRLAQRRERLAQPESSDQLRRRKLRRAGAFMGAAVVSYFAARYFDLPPVAFTSSAVANRLSKSPSVATSGTPIAPEKQDTTVRRFKALMDRRRERKTRGGQASDS